MPRNETISSEEEDSIWTYTSQNKKIKLTQQSPLTVIKSGRENKKQRRNPRKGTRTSPRKNSDICLNSLPLVEAGTNELNDYKGDFKSCMTYTQHVKNETFRSRKSKLSNIKTDPESKNDKKTKTKSSRSQQRLKKPHYHEPATPNDKIRTGRCRVCQFPFSALSKIETPTWHEEICLSIPYSSQDQCPSGIHCSSTLESHYKKIRHTALSRSEHKKSQARPTTTNGVVENAKMKLQFDDDKSTLFQVPTASLDCIVELSSSPECSQNCSNSMVDIPKSPSKPTQNHQATAPKIENTASIFTITKCRDWNFKNQDNIGKAVINQSEVGVNLDTKASMTLGKDGSRINPQPVLDDSEDVITEVNPDELYPSDSCSSVEDIDNITDNSRNVSQMLKDIFDETQDLDKQQKSSALGVADVLESNLSDSISDDDTDILLTSFCTVSDHDAKSTQLRPLAEGSKTIRNNFVDNKTEDSDTDKINKTVGAKETGPDKRFKDEVKREISSSKRMTSTNYIMESHGDSCSRDSAKGFFARKLEEQKVKTSTPSLGGSLNNWLSKNGSSIDKVEQSELNDVSAIGGTISCSKKSETMKSKEETTALFGQYIESQLPHISSPFIRAAEKIDKPNIETKFSKQNKAKTTKDNKLETSKKCKLKLSQKKNSKSKNIYRKEIELMQLRGLGKITIESDSSGDEYAKSENISHSNVYSTFDNCSKNPAKCTDNLFMGAQFDETLEMRNELADDKHDNADATQTRTVDTNVTAFQNSQKFVNLTPNFQISDVRTLETDTSSAGGFFRDETIGDINDDSIVYDKLSELDADDIDINTDISLQDNGETEGSTENLPIIKTEIDCSANSESSDTSKVFDIVAGMVKDIQKNALEILMQTSKAFQSRGKNTTMNERKKSSAPQSNRTINDVLMSAKGQTSQATAAKSKDKYTTNQNNKFTGREPSATNERKCPFYKKIPGTSLTVDAFRYGSIPDCKAYILTHFHYDHYGGLKKSFSHPLYCSQITGNLVKKKIGVKPEFVHTIPLNTPTVIEDVEITFLEANHCPGAVLILLKLKTGRVDLHTGDFRACTDMESYPELLNLKIHSLYLDTTYCDPQYDFPSQREVVILARKLAKDTVASNDKTLIVCGSYTIGKERIFRGIAEELDCKICVARDKKSVIDCLEDKWLQSRTSLSWSDSRLHVLPMGKLKLEGLKEHLQKNGKGYNAVLAIKPTGWTYNKKLIAVDHIKPEIDKDNIKVYGLPYSEHSSYLEMKRFVQFTRPDKVLPTVNNGNYHSRKKMEAIFEAWMEEVY